MDIPSFTLTHFAYTSIYYFNMYAGNIQAYNSDLDLIKIVDTEDEVVAVIDAFYKKFDLSPNF